METRRDSRGTEYQIENFDRACYRCPEGEWILVQPTLQDLQKMMTFGVPTGDWRDLDAYALQVFDLVGHVLR